MKNLLSLLIILSFLACKESTEKKGAEGPEQPEEKNIPAEPGNGIGDGAVSPAVAFATSIEQAHNKKEFRTREAVAFDISLRFGGKERLNGRISMLTNSGKVRLEKADGTSLIYDGSNVYMSPKAADEKGARFDMFTWQYFFAMPFKLTDPGTNWELMGKTRFKDSLRETAKLTFGENIGDAPDDWYVVYKDEKTGRLKAAAYIVTFNKDQSEAEKNPHAIVYKDYKTINQVPFATLWSFHNWSEENGIEDEIGSARISNIQFFDPSVSFFEKPEDAKIIEK
ncbi:DUF6503 family protein [Salegentibacter chungangensis]|uniref:DUF6503 family protein n=1 Tax=Salegentibacter chungangensis TaxID=1335724 RepID=A0ABW3NNI8_9FLAO